MTAQNEAETLQRLIDQQELHDLLVQRWCIGVDTVNWKLVRSLYADEVKVNYFYSTGVPEPKLWKVDDWLNFCRVMEGFDASQHSITNFIYTFDKHGAEVKSYLVAEHFLDENSYTVGGQYTHCFQRSSEGWKLSKISFEIWWTRGDRALFEKAKDLVANNRAPRSDKAIV